VPVYILRNNLKVTEHETMVLPCVPEYETWSLVSRGEGADKYISTNERGRLSKYSRR
jgi:hypothetical protein